MLPEARRQQVLVVVSLLLVLCLAASALCLAGPMLWPRLPLPFGYMMTVCAVFNTAPQLQVGLYWNSPFFSSVWPYTPQSRGCTVIPWLPPLPQRGQFIFQG